MVLVEDNPWLDEPLSGSGSGLPFLPIVAFNLILMSQISVMYFDVGHKP